MNNNFINTDIDLLLIDRSNNNLTFYISTKLFIDYNDQSNNIYITKDGLDAMDYFELEVSIDKPFINIYKPHYYGKQSTHLLKYIDQYIIEWMEDLSGEDIKEVYND